MNFEKDFDKKLFFQNHKSNFWKKSLDKTSIFFIPPMRDGPRWQGQGRVTESIIPHEKALPALKVRLVENLSSQRGILKYSVPGPTLKNLLNFLSAQCQFGDTFWGEKKKLIQFSNLYIILFSFSI